MRRARFDVERKKMYSAIWKWVPATYYDWPLEQRAKCLGAKSTQLLCKALLMDNKQSDGMDPWTNPKFVLVVLQYDSTLDVRKLANSIRSLKAVKDRKEFSKFDFRVADAADNDRLTGYPFNSVTPFGLLESVPIVLSEAVAQIKFLWMGGGHIHLKLGMSVSQFCKATGAIIADISQPKGILAGAEHDGTD